MSLETAAELFNQAVGYKKRRYAIHRGVLYRGTPTVPGRSYHGFPERPSEFERLPRQVKEAIWQRAEGAGYKEELRKWLQSQLA